MSNAINPEHYNKGIYEAINVIEAWGLGFSLGNAVKYICRAGKKEGNTAKQDLQKAVWYLEREIDRISKEECAFGDLKPPELEYRTDKPAVTDDHNYSDYIFKWKEGTIWESDHPDFVENASFEEKKYIPKSHENSLV